MGDLLVPAHLLILLFVVGPIALGITVPPYWMIYKKAGFSPWLSILTLVPLVKWIVLWVVAFSDWKPRPPQLP
jgi:hypothetical protein